MNAIYNIYIKNKKNMKRLIILFMSFALMLSLLMISCSETTCKKECSQIDSTVVKTDSIKSTVDTTASITDTVK